MKDLQPDVLAVYKKRVAYHNEISRLLENDMIVVSPEPVKEVHNNEEDEKEDEKEQEEEKKVEEKTLYDIHFVYRTIEKRLN